MHHRCVFDVNNLALTMLPILLPKANNIIQVDVEKCLKSVSHRIGFHVYPPPETVTKLLECKKSRNVESNITRMVDIIAQRCIFLILLCVLMLNIACHNITRIENSCIFVIFLLQWQRSHFDILPVREDTILSN